LGLSGEEKESLPQSGIELRPSSPYVSHCMYVLNGTSWLFVLSGSCREASVSPQQITDHLQGQSDRLDAVVRRKLFTKKKTAVKCEIKLFTEKINGISLGDMTRSAV
jgi:hypothetical protein